MNDLFSIDIITPQAASYYSEVSSLVIPAEFGYMGILANHAPLAACISKGKIILKGKDNQIKIFNNTGNGFVEVLKNKITLILESAIDAKEG